MALLNGMYIPVIEEKVTKEIETVAHPVESGIDITDHVKKNPTEISVSGEIVGEDANNIITQISEMNKTGVVITYVGCNYFKNGQIINFDTNFDHTIWGGCSFEMTIREVRFAGNSYEPNANLDHRSVGDTTNAGLQQREHNSSASTVTHTVKNGDTLRTIAQSYNTPYSVLYDESSEQGLLEEYSPNYLEQGSRIRIGNR